MQVPFWFHWLAGFVTGFSLCVVIWFFVDRGVT